MALEEYDNKQVDILCIVSARQTKATRSGDTMAFLTVEDTTGSMEVLVFPKILQRYGQLLTVGSVVVLSGRISVREEEDAKLLCEKAVTIQDRLAWRSGSPVRKPNAGAGSGKRPGLYLRIPSRQGKEMEKAQNLLEIFEERPPFMSFSRIPRRWALLPAPCGFSQMMCCLAS